LEQHTYGTYGKHLIIDFHGIDSEVLDSIEYLKISCLTAAKMTGANVLDVMTWKFEPQGATILVLLSESHLSLHTAPEHQYAALDIYTCGNVCDPEKALVFLRDIFKPTEINRQYIERGVR
jgi:S-adenosylmethionine decarboxylase